MIHLAHGEGAISPNGHNDTFRLRLRLGLISSYTGLDANVCSAFDFSQFFLQPFSFAVTSTFFTSNLLQFVPAQSLSLLPLRDILLRTINITRRIAPRVSEQLVMRLQLSV